MNPNQGPRMTFEDNNVNFVYRSSLRIRYENIRKYRIMETGANWKSESLQRTLRGEGEGNRSIQVDPQLDVQPWGDIADFGGSSFRCFQDFHQ